MKIKKYMTKLLMLAIMIFSFSAIAYSQVVTGNNDEEFTKSGKQLKNLTSDNDHTFGVCKLKNINDGEGFIKMKTKLCYTYKVLRKSDKTETVCRTYGEKEKPSTTLKPFPRDKELLVQVQFYPEMYNKKMYNCKFGSVRLNELLIPVEINMKKQPGTRISVVYEGGIEEEKVKTTKYANNDNFIFFIQNKPNNSPEAIFTVKPGDKTETMKINIKYRTDKNKIVYEEEET